MSNRVTGSDRGFPINTPINFAKAGGLQPDGTVKAPARTPSPSPAKRTVLRFQSGKGLATQTEIKSDEEDDK